AQYASIKKLQNPDAMRSWIQQNVFLWNGENVEVSEEVVALFMNNQGIDCGAPEVEKLLRHGWNVTKQEFEQALMSNDPQVLELLLDHSRCEENLFFALALHNRADLAAYMIEHGKIPTPEHLHTAIANGSTDVVRVLIEHGVSSKGALLLA